MQKIVQRLTLEEKFRIKFIVSEVRRKRLEEKVSVIRAKREGK